MQWSSINFNIFNLFMGLLIGSATGIITSHFGKFIKSKGEDRSLKGILILWKRSPLKTVLLVAIIAPVAEEVLFRFIGISLLNHVLPGLLPLLITSILFGLAHNQYPVNIITGIIGLILAFTYLSYGLVASIMAHSVHNIISVTYLVKKAERLLGRKLSIALHEMSINEVMQELDI
ncbi:CPBP family intramembrane metalloprotease [Clostridium sp. 'deep sea']|uniref:CPBP family intramembrane glutamic endopeptidase n=1 Tax=Clostridium sp. 'deep sea' TaxID=2779445 RepID=UPI001896A1DD|nr:CPBP family intramembrane glutamic endopeptidase [Clostridium sp. 'deep sea']QOR36622.1 CPBP family intramembrane metalloprotease [Clostridium sp. 'deep sea']